MVRARTCYSSLRNLIDLYSLLSVIVMLIVGLLLVSSQIMIGVVVIVMGCFLVIAGRQSALLLIDIADTLIEQNRKKNRESNIAP